MPARRICLLLSSLVLFLVHTAAAEAQTWTKHSYATDGFEVEFSGPVKVNPTDVDDEVRRRLVRATSYLQEGNDFEYVVGASLQRVPVNFERAMKNSMGAFKCATILSDTPVQFPKGRAREIRGSSCIDGRFRVDARYYTVGPWLYQVIALHPLNGSREAEARRFVESFRVTGQGQQ